MGKFEEILTKYWGYPEFRDLQKEIIESIADGKDTLGLMPTGGGKSITFQVYSLSTEGICLVVTPLIALMKDQVENLNSRGIKALAIHSGMTAHEIKITLDNAVWGNYKFLYISPERIGTKRFLERVEQMNVNLVTVDESHCISQWGYDFRPSYLKIARLREILPKVPVLALTATATPKVVDDIQKRLNFSSNNVLQKSFVRNNLNYLVRYEEDKQGYMLRTIAKTKGSGIVYVRSRKRTKEIAQLLKENNISADFYHAGLGNFNRSRKQNNWKSGKTRVIVATNAFGMGIDKADVRFVIHVDLPDSLEAYFQEAGRAGRDEKKAAAVLLFNKSDRTKLTKGIRDKFPGQDIIKRVYNALGNYLQIAIGFGKGQTIDFNLANFCSSYNFAITTAYNSLKILERAGFLELTDELDNPGRIHFIIRRDELYKFQVANESFDTFIKLLLRSYTGVFTQYVPIDWELLAQRANTNTDTIKEYLKQLASHKIIHYIPKKKTPYIVLTKERLDEKHIHIPKEHYDARKLAYEKQVEAVLRYAESTDHCRSEMLIEYFGETDTTPCGTCDVCINKKKLPLNAEDFKRYSEKIANIVNNEACSLEDLVVQLEGDTEQILDIVRWHIDNDKLQYRVDHLLEWKK